MQVRSPGGHESPGGRHGHLPRQRDAFPRGVPLSPGVLTCTLGPGPQCPPRGQERIQQDLRARPLGTALRGRTDPLEETGSSGALGPPAAGPPSPLHRPAPDCDLSLALSDLCPPQRSCSPPPALLLWGAVCPITTRPLGLGRGCPAPASRPPSNPSSLRTLCESQVNLEPEPLNQATRGSRESPRQTPPPPEQSAQTTREDITLYSAPCIPSLPTV